MIFKSKVLLSWIVNSWNEPNRSTLVTSSGQLEEQPQIAASSTHLDNVSLEFPAYFFYRHLMFRLKEKDTAIISTLSVVQYVL